VIEDIRRLMVESAETTSGEQLGRRREEVATVAAQQKKQQQQIGVGEKLQRLIWDPGGIPTA
jgi:hypothetical protein